MIDKDVVKQQVDQVLASAGWEHIEAVILKHIAMVKDPARVSSSSRNDVYAREVRAGVLAGKALESVLNQIKLLGRINNINKDKDHE